jgi:hypothetical protein
MNATFLFRLDGSKDNDTFFELRRNQGVDDVYSGTPLKIGPGWIPDLVEVKADTGARLVTITLIELEASETVAKESSRKYLPEASTQIIESLVGYLNGVIAQCRQTADPRAEKFQNLLQFISDGPSFAVRTAAALRNAPSFVEDFPLIDQPSSTGSLASHQRMTTNLFLFEGSKLLSRTESNGAIRAIRMFDDVIHARDLSGGTFRSWLKSRVQLLYRELEDPGQKYPELRRLISKKRDRGIRLDCGAACRELAEMWHSSQQFRLTPNQIGNAITNFYSVAIAFREHEPMHVVFEKARSAMQET